MEIETKECKNSYKMAARYKQETLNSAKNVFFNVISKSKCNVSIWDENTFGSTLMTLEQMQQLRVVVNKSIMLMKFTSKKE